MKKLINTIIRNLVPTFIFNEYKTELLKYVNLSYSQEGEDSMLIRLLGQQKKGFYVDIGAHHPLRFSNTYLFYQKGWTGINIDAMPGSMMPFHQLRPNDINLEIGISKEESELEYNIFNEPALNTFSKEEATKKDGLANYKIIKKVEIKTYPLSKILQKHCSSFTQIDFMSIDVEGLDLEVLESNDWAIFRPKYILIEDLGRLSLEDIPTKSAVYKFLIEQNYNLFSKTVNTLFFIDKNLQ